MKKVVVGFCIIVTLLTTPLSVYAEEEVSPVQSPAEIEATTPTPVGPPAYIIVQRKSNMCYVYDANLQIIKSFVVSTGRPGHETPLGVYQIYQHATGAGYHPMVDGTYGRWCMRFANGGYMFHTVCYQYAGALEPIPEEVAALGTSASRGCVRLSVADAEWLYKNTPNGVSVVITDD